MLTLFCDILWNVLITLIVLCTVSMDVPRTLPSFHSVEEFVPDDALDASFLDDSKDVKTTIDSKQDYR